MKFPIFAFKLLEYRKRLPLIRQSEAAECGNACLAMVAGYHGHITDIAGIRHRFETSANGSTLRELSYNAESMGLLVRAVKLDINQLSKLSLPAILHWNFNHFVVLRSFNNNKAIIHDPGKGVVNVSIDELSNCFTGVALELTPTQNFQKGNFSNKAILSDLWSKITGLKKSILQVVFLSSIVQLYVMIAPQYMQIVVDVAIENRNESILTVVAIGFVVALLINVGASVLRQLIIVVVGSSMSYYISINLFNHLIRLPLSYFERRHIGDIASRFESIEPIRKFLSEGLVIGIVDGVMAILTLLLMFSYSPSLAFISIFFLSMYIVIRIGLFARFRRASEDLIMSNANENSDFIEVMRGALTIKSFAQENTRREKWQNLLAKAINDSIKLQNLRISFQSANDLIFGLEHIIVIYIAAMMVIDGQFTVGMIFAFVAYRSQFVQNTVSLVELLIQFRMLGLHVERMADIMQSEKERDSGDQIKIRGGAIKIEDLSFSYGDNLPMIIDSGNFKIQAGESVAIVGPSGGGKTTLLKLMMGLLQPNSGRIIVDGSSLDTCNPFYYRKQIACVMQGDTLFSGSLIENITFFASEIEFDRVIACARATSVLDDIQNLPMGFDTQVGDMGSNLSGGQVQRIMLARAIYQKPKILFIDEGTSNLDVDTEINVSNAIRELGITRVMSAHRQETIDTADRVFRLRGGKIEELQVME